MQGDSTFEFTGQAKLNSAFPCNSGCLLYTQQPYALGMISNWPPHGIAALCVGCSASNTAYIADVHGPVICLHVLCDLGLLT